MIAASEPAKRADFLPLEYGGASGVWVSEAALGDMLAGFERDKGALEAEIARAKVGESIAVERADTITKNASEVHWRATYGPWLGFLGGVVMSVAVLLGGVYVNRAIAPQAPEVIHAR